MSKLQAGFSLDKEDLMVLILEKYNLDEKFDIKPTDEIIEVSLGDEGVINFKIEREI